jgi:hypothetical protein
LGIKLNLLCDWICVIWVYTRQDTNNKFNPDIGVSGSLITTLIVSYLNKGHSVYVDNGYTSPAFSLFLHRLKTSSCGIAQGNRKGMPALSQKLFQVKYSQRFTYGDEVV